MTQLDPRTGYLRVLSYEEIVARGDREKEAALKKPDPVIVRNATLLMNSPLFERLRNTVSEDLETQRLNQVLTKANEAQVEKAAAEAGVPKEIAKAMPGPDDDDDDDDDARRMPPPPPPGSGPSGGPGPSGGGGGADAGEGRAQGGSDGQGEQGQGCTG